MEAIASCFRTTVESSMSLGKDETRTKILGDRGEGDGSEPYAAKREIWRKDRKSLSSRSYYSSTDVDERRESCKCSIGCYIYTE